MVTEKLVRATFRLAFLEEAALKITFVRIKNLLTVLTVLQVKKKKREANDAQISHTLRKNRTKRV